MKKKMWLLFFVFLGLGMCLYINRPTPAAPDIQNSEDVVRYINDNIAALVKKDPEFFLMIHEMIDTSPYLKKQKIAFLKKYYGKKSSTELRNNLRLLRFMVATQEVQILDTQVVYKQ